MLTIKEIDLLQCLLYELYDGTKKTRSLIIFLKTCDNQRKPRRAELTY